MELICNVWTGKRRHIADSFPPCPKCGNQKSMRIVTKRVGEKRSQSLRLDCQVCLDRKGRVNQPLI